MHVLRATGERSRRSANEDWHGGLRAACSPTETRCWEGARLDEYMGVRIFGCVLLGGLCDGFAANGVGTG